MVWSGVGRGQGCQFLVWELGQDIRRLGEVERERGSGEIDEADGVVVGELRGVAKR